MKQPSGILRRWLLERLLPVVLVVSASNSHAQTYSLTLIESLDADPSHMVAIAINNRGDVTGQSDTVELQDHAFLYSKGVTLDLGTLGGDYSIGRAINDSSQVTGYSYVTGDADLHVFETFSGVMTDVGNIGTDSRGYAINDAGQIAGEFVFNGTGYTSHAFIVKNGLMHDIGIVSDVADSHGIAINSAGQVTGLAFSTRDLAYHAFVTERGVMKLMQNIPGTSSTGVAINASGEITGYTSSPDIAPLHAFVTVQGTLKDLGTLGGRSSTGVAISDAGQVVGYSETTNGSTHAFVTVGNAMRDLGTHGGKYSAATSINFCGEIVGNSDTPNGEVDAFIYRNGSLVDLNSLININDPLKFTVSLTYAVAITDSDFILALGTDSRYYVLQSSAHRGPISGQRSSEKFGPVGSENACHKFPL